MDPQPTPPPPALTGELLEPQTESEWTGSTYSELEERRSAVLALRLRRLSQTKIAQALKGQYPTIDQSVVSRDLAWIGKHWRERYGPVPTLDPAEEVGEALEMFKGAERSALRDFDKLDPKTATKGRNACLRTAMIARQMRINLLQDLGFIDRKVPSLTITLRADAVRSALREEGLLTERTLPTVNGGPGETPAVDEDEVERWLARANT